MSEDFITKEQAKVFKRMLTARISVELKSQVEETARGLVRQWLKVNKQELNKQLSDQFKKQIPTILAKAQKELQENIEVYINDDRW